MPRGSRQKCMRPLVLACWLWQDKCLSARGRDFCESSKNSSIGHIITWVRESNPRPEHASQVSFLSRQAWPPMQSWFYYWPSVKLHCRLQSLPLSGMNSYARPFVFWGYSKFWNAERWGFPAIHQCLSQAPKLLSSQWVCSPENRAI